MLSDDGSLHHMSLMVSCTQSIQSYHSMGGFISWTACTVEVCTVGFKYSFLDGLQYGCLHAMCILDVLELVVWLGCSCVGGHNYKEITLLVVMRGMYIALGGEFNEDLHSPLLL